eukprot:SM005422S18188  [mRNA]  locus=s5422:248:964:- [translate_table: standard]
MGPRLAVNADLELYRARTLARRGSGDAAEAILRMCVRDWPEDGRAYLALGKLLATSRNDVARARAVYEAGCQATRGENAFLWQAWAVLEARCGSLGRARTLFDGTDTTLSFFVRLSGFLF